MFSRGIFWVDLFTHVYVLNFSPNAFVGKLVNEFAFDSVFFFFFFFFQNLSRISQFKNITSSKFPFTGASLLVGGKTGNFQVRWLCSDKQTFPNCKTFSFGSCNRVNMTKIYECCGTRQKICGGNTCLSSTQANI